MSPKRFFPLLFISLALAACTTDLQINTVENTPKEEAENVSGEAILLLSEAAADDFADAPAPASLDALGIRSIERVFPDAGPFEARHRAAGLHRWYRVSYDPAVSRTKADSDLRDLPGVEDVSFPPKQVLMSAFNDPMLPRQWHYINTVQYSGFRQGCDINVAPVWEQFTGGTNDVIVAIVDGGVDMHHEDLAGVVLSPEEGSRNFIKRYKDDQIFGHEHGTHVGGTIAAINDNGIGVCGIAGGTDGRGGVRLMSCQIVAPGHDDLEGDDAAALVWAADHGAVIANCSWGQGYPTEDMARRAAEDFLRRKSAIKSAIDYFVDNAGLDESGRQVGPMAGGVIFFASGNEGHRYGTPACYDRVIAVAAHGPQGKLTMFANYGDWVDLVAPGGSDSDYNAKEWVLSTTPENTYSSFPGTSMACPHAAGVAALLVSYFGGPGFTNAMLTKAILGGARKDFLDLQGREIGGGMLDALGAFNKMLEEGNPDARISFSASKQDWTVKSHVADDMSVRIAGNAWKQLPVTVTSDCPGVTASWTKTIVDLHVDALKAQPGTYSIRIQVGDEAGKTFPLVILPNHAPKQIRPLENCLVNANSAAAFSLELDQYFQDPDDEALSYDLNISGDPILTTELDPEKELLTVKPAGYGLATLTVTALDARGEKCAATFQILARDGYRALDIFPNPVTDWLHVRPGTEQKLQVELFNRLGARVYASGSVEAGPFKPLDIDMQGMPGGVYTLRVNGENFTVTKP